MPGFLPLPSASDLARFSLASLRPQGGISDTERLGNLAEEHAFDLQLATDLEIAARRAEHFAPHLSAETFLNRWVAVTDDLQAMLSIRYRNLDVNRPFVDVSLTSRPVQESDLPALKRAALDGYGAFQPPHLRFWSAAAPGAFPGTTPDMRVLAAPLNDLRTLSVPDGVQLVPTVDDRHYEEASAAYRAVDEQHPAHPDQARLLSQEDLQECIEAGTMFDVIWNGTWGGYVGTLAETKLGLPVHTVQELILTPQARGRGFGPALSILLARALPDDGRLLYGTVHGENVGARQAALAAGREDLGGWQWAELNRA